MRHRPSDGAAATVAFCHTAAILSSHPVQRQLERAHKALRHSTQFLKSCDAGYRDLEQVAAYADAVKAAFEEVTSPSVRPAIRPAFVAEANSPHPELAGVMAASLGKFKPQK